MTASTIQAVVLGASAGAVDALSIVLPLLPQAFSLPIAIVVHLPPQKTSNLADLFATRCSLPVREAEDKAPIEDGVVYFAPPDYHLLVESDGHFSLSNELPVQYSRPSIDVLFETAAEAYAESLLGIVLTGANSDGARGLQAICQAGGHAIVQSPDEAFAVAMPQAALSLCPGARSMPLRQIAEYLCEIGTNR